MPDLSVARFLELTSPALLKLCSLGMILLIKRDGFWLAKIELMHYSGLLTLCACAILHNWHQIAPIAYYSKNRIINENITQNAQKNIL